MSELIDEDSRKERKKYVLSSCALDVLDRVFVHSQEMEIAEFIGRFYVGMLSKSARKKFELAGRYDTDFIQNVQMVCYSHQLPLRHLLTATAFYILHRAEQAGLVKTREVTEREEGMELRKLMVTYCSGTSPASGEAQA